jgi:predicted nuclease of predicted toxin-antitoxin system
VTLDKDFGELAVLHGARHSGIVRLVGFTGPQQGATCVQVLERFASDLEAGALITAEPGRVRVRSV